jgi:hypothetical protein
MLPLSDGGRGVVLVGELDGVLLGEFDGLGSLVSGGSDGVDVVPGPSVGADVGVSVGLVDGVLLADGVADGFGVPVVWSGVGLSSGVGTDGVAITGLVDESM